MKIGVTGLRPRDRTGHVLSGFGALLVAIVGAAGLQWIAWQTAPALATNHEAQAIVDATFQRPPDGPPQRFDARFGYRLGAGGATLLLGGDEYEAGAVRFAYTVPDQQVARAVADSQRAFESDDWRVEPTSDRFWRYAATKGNRRVEVHWSGSPSQLTVKVMRNEPDIVIPAAVIGALLGAVAGWLLFSAFSNAIRHRPSPTDRVARILAIAGLGLLSPATVFAVVLAVEELFADVYPQAPLWAPVTFVVIRPAGFLGALLVATAFGLVVTGRLRPTPSPAGRESR